MTTVLVVSPTGASINGAEIAGLTLLDHLSRRGLRVLNAFPTHISTTDPPTAASYHEAMAKAGIEPLPMDFGWWIPGDEVFSRREFAATLALVDAIETHEVDVVITNTSNVPWGALAAALTGRPHHWLIHEFPTGPFAWLVDRYDFVAAFSTRIYCASPSLRDEIERRVRTTGIPTPVSSFRPVSPEPATAPLTDGEPRLLVIGAVNRRKRQLDVVRALARLRSRGLSVPVVFIGGVEDQDYRAEIEDAVSEADLGELVEFRGHLDDPWRAARARDIVIQPSETEVFSLVACEAAARDLRILLSRTPSSQDIAQVLGGVPLFAVGDTDELAGAVEGMLAHADAGMPRARQVGIVARREFSAATAYADLTAALRSARERPPIGKGVTPLLPFLRHLLHA